ncbi:MAG: DoxX family protein [Pedobacter sp.]|nr:MAG: DoxX family protein [Pedobacter sp.]
MKTTKFTYYATTAIISGMMLFIAFETLTKPEVKVSMAHLGFPDYFRIELGILKVVGAMALILPMVPEKVKSFAYFGFALTFISAFIAHTASGDPISVAIMPIIFLVILLVSYLFYRKVKA